MKLIEHFNTFLSDIVNLNQTRIDTLEDRVETISQFLRTSDYAPRIRRFAAQGSWAHKTIIKPLNNKDFDADLVVFIDAVEGWLPADYITELHRVFKAHGTYCDKATLETRCVTIRYANDFHLDVVPCIQTISSRVYSFVVCNRVDGQFERTNPEGYTAWLEGKNLIVGNNSLRKITRLVKYLRDVKETFTVKSILLTTLLGERIDSVIDPHFGSNYFPDLPTSLRTLFARLDDYLQQYPNVIDVNNPVLPIEKFTRHWDNEKYQNFREKIHEHREWIDDAYNESNRDESIRKWRRVFGEDFAEGEVVERSTKATALALHISGAISVSVLQAIRSGSKEILNRIPQALPHVLPAPWRIARAPITVSVSAKEHQTERGTFIRDLTPGSIVEKDRWIRFEARTLLPSNFYVMWQVVNTGEDAAIKKGRGLRGGFYKSEDRFYRWEHTEYTGAHWVEAFVINKRNRECVGRSGRFFIVIE